MKKPFLLLFNILVFGNVFCQYVREIALLNGGARNYTILDRYISGLTLSGFESIYEYTIWGNGSIAIHHQVLPQGSMPQMLPRIGLSLMLKDEYDNDEWYGRGHRKTIPTVKPAIG